MLIIIHDRYIFHEIVCFLCLLQNEFSIYYQQIKRSSIYDTHMKKGWGIKKYRLNCRRMWMMPKRRWWVKTDMCGRSHREKTVRNTWISLKSIPHTNPSPPPKKKKTFQDLGSIFNFNYSLIILSK